MASSKLHVLPVHHAKPRVKRVCVEKFERRQTIDKTTTTRRTVRRNQDGECYLLSVGNEKSRIEHFPSRPIDLSKEKCQKPSHPLKPRGRDYLEHFSAGVIQRWRLHRRHNSDIQRAVAATLSTRHRRGSQRTGVSDPFGLSPRSNRQPVSRSLSYRNAAAKKTRDRPKVQGP